MRSVKLAVKAAVATAFMAVSFSGIAGAAPQLGPITLGGGGTGGLINVGGSAPVVNVGNVNVCGVQVLGTPPALLGCQ